MKDMYRPATEPRGGSDFNPVCAIPDLLRHWSTNLLVLAIQQTLIGLFLLITPRPLLSGRLAGCCLIRHLIDTFALPSYTRAHVLYGDCGSSAMITDHRPLGERVP
jgi:hypothetical protein